MEKTLKVCVTGAAGQISYSFIPQLCRGNVFGNETRIELRLLDIEPMMGVLEGINMEIVDGAYSLVSSCEYGHDPMLMFRDIDVGVFIGGFPRKQGMERKDLMDLNSKIFVGQGKALNEVASKDCKVVVVANPANTNCLVLQQNAPSLNKRNFTALTRLDQHRAQAQLAMKTQSHVNQINGIVIWGNHSSTQYVDIRRCTINGQNAIDKVNDEQWVQNEFLTKVQKRGAEIISIKKNSSIFSAANALVDHLKDWYLGNQNVNSVAVSSDGNVWGITEGLIFSMPIKNTGDWKIEIQSDYDIQSHEFTYNKIKISEQELIEERNEALNQ